MKRWMLALAAGALVLAACGGSGTDGVASLDSDTAAVEDAAEGVSSDQSNEEALLEFSACMRNNGVEDFEDPIVNADGSVEFGIVEGTSSGGGPFGGVDREVVEAAFEACTEYLEGVALGLGDGGFNITEIEDTLVEFAACMRDNGVDMDDPDLSAFGPGQDNDDGGFASPFGDIDITDPDVQAAVEECQGIFGDFGRFGGGDS